MDALSDVLRVSHLTGGVFLRADLSAPWCIALNIPREHCGPALGTASHLMTYHYVIGGELRIRLDGPNGESDVVRSGEVVILPRNDPHMIGTDLTMRAIPGRDVVQPPNGAGLYSIRHGGGGETTEMICGFIGYAGTESNPLIPMLPRLLRFNVEQGPAADWVRSTFQYAAAEVSAGSPGSQTVLAKLSELLFVETVRRYAETMPAEQTGWLAGLREPHVGRALALLHGDIARRWTVDELARAAGLSRSALSDRFLRLIGVPPINYLTNWRMQVAAATLRGTNAALAQVAQDVGYDSEAAFSRAFKKAFGVAPGTWRREGDRRGG
ncbi:MAG TPA: AraC family transcriptional regulator [Pseudolabrys sp.]|nr:AraC family transcriptional regulator [Pseudolabrys sp.]